MIALNLGRHALRSALVPVVTLLGLQLSYMIVGSVFPSKRTRDTDRWTSSSPKTFGSATSNRNSSTPARGRRILEKVCGRSVIGRCRFAPMFRGDRKTSPFAAPAPARRYGSTGATST